MSYTPPPGGGSSGGFPEPPPSGGGPPAGSPYGHPGPHYEHPQTTTILVLGILSLVLCPILGPIAWSMGNSALNEIDAGRGQMAGRGQVNAGRICGIIGTVFLILSILYIVFAVTVLSTYA